MRIALAIVTTLGLLASCAHTEPRPINMTSAIRTAKTSADYEALAKRYEDAAKDMQAKAEEQKRMLAEYQEHGYYYGRQTEYLIEHSQALIRFYQEAANVNLNMAHYHHRLAEDARQ
ncbi:MAG: hypothetical protein KGM95_09195 [Betaproteobacteria bacterium]|nr:hypothetical protein [Betaproteobacteria bacterium]